ncbi:hypothetical protein IYY11_02195 [Methylocystis sp. H62]|uniref:hypothetical protein n=1 Tax=Methylocystis sp. H62 TaxID=2785789 RepID=UPI0018C28458|nr:hypothetical protein [Methylocystis sp. H62]MBG0792280.1 hypothetical protein [Methylocystis sp. H62]
MRAFAAGLAALLLLLQGLAALGVVRMHPAADGAAAIRVVMQDLPCAPDQPVGDPVHDAGKNHWPCCPLCNATGDASFDAPLSALRIANLPRSRGLHLSEASSNRLAKRPPTGWATSWSSQAPPLFS